MAISWENPELMGIYTGEIILGDDIRRSGHPRTIWNGSTATPTGDSTQVLRMAAKGIVNLIQSQRLRSEGNALTDPVNFTKFLAKIG